jgi:cell fate regulator YaaT (PSP1 superfamily)
MKKIVGIRFKSAGKIYHFDCGAFVLNEGDKVIVETEKGLGFGFVAIPPLLQDSSRAGRPLKKVYRIANEKDQCEPSHVFFLQRTAA